jgi:hypothetical protein
VSWRIFAIATPSELFGLSLWVIHFSPVPQGSRIGVRRSSQACLQCQYLVGGHGFTAHAKFPLLRHQS